MAIVANNFLCDKVQRAFAALIAQGEPSGIPVAQIYKGLDNALGFDETTEPTTRALPCVECVCTSAQPIEQDNDGILWVADLNVVIRSSADDNTEDQHHELVQGVLDLLYNPTLAADLSAISGYFSVQGVNIGPQSWGIDGRTWHSDFGFRVFCCGSDIS